MLIFFEICFLKLFFGCPPNLGSDCIYSILHRDCRCAKIAFYLHRDCRFWKIAFYQHRDCRFWKIAFYLHRDASRGWKLPRMMVPRAGVHEIVLRAPRGRDLLHVVGILLHGVGISLHLFGISLHVSGISLHMLRISFARGCNFVARAWNFVARAWNVPKPGACWGHKWAMFSVST